jgi:cytochrome c
MRRKSLVTPLVLIGLAAVGAGALFAFLRHGVSARDMPWAAEAFVARRLRHLAIPRGARSMTNPIPLTAGVLAGGMAHFADHCAACHANDGSGGTEMGRGLYPKVPDMRLAGTQNLSDGELFYIIENGVRFTGMPAWGTGDRGQQEASWHLVHFIRHLPRLAPEELEEMKRMNPRSPEELREEMEEERFLRGEEVPETRPAHEH